MPTHVKIHHARMEAFAYQGAIDINANACQDMQASIVMVRTLDNTLFSKSRNYIS